MEKTEQKFEEMTEALFLAQSALSRAENMLALVDRWMDEYTTDSDYEIKEAEERETWIMVRYEELWGALDVLRFVQETLRLGLAGKELLPNGRQIFPTHKYERVAS